MLSNCFLTHSFTAFHEKVFLEKIKECLRPGCAACWSPKLAREHKFIAKTLKFLQGFEKNTQEKLKLNKFGGCTCVKSQLKHKYMILSFKHIFMFQHAT